MPAKLVPDFDRGAGIQVRTGIRSKKAWIPACAGMTENEVDFESTQLEPLGFEPSIVECSGLAQRLGAAV